jgi:hypothetical protein
MIGAWHVLPNNVYQEQVNTAIASNQTLNISEHIYTHALRTQDVVLYFHGNAASRGVFRRVTVYKVTISLLSYTPYS